MNKNEEYLNIILSDEKRFPKYYTYYIDGNNGPTGKTWLTLKLAEHGYNAVDVSDKFYERNCEYVNDRVYVDRGSKTVFIILTNYLEEYKEKWKGYLR